VKQLESKLSRNIVKGLKRAYGGFWVKLHGGPFQRSGLPDIIGLCIPPGKKRGRFFGLETKLPGEEDTLTKLQFLTLKAISEAGGYSGVITSLDDAKAIVDKASK